MSTVPQSPVVAEKTGAKTSYGQILKSTAWIGGSSAANVLIGMVRSKAMAMLLGPAGFGLAGLYLSATNLIQSIAGMGINSSGVREIASAVGRDDRESISRTAKVLEGVSIALGAFGALILLVFAKPIAVATLDSDSYAPGIRILSLAVLFRLISDGQGALLQGLRQVSSLAKVNTLGALLGTIATLPLIYFWGADGVVPSLVAVAAAALAVSWWYRRQVKLEEHPLPPGFLWRQSGELLKLGFAFMLSGMLMLGSAYVVRVTVLHKLGLEAAGLYQAAWTLGSMYVAFVLQAMGADFYPRLTASIEDRRAANRLVNEQTLVSLLLAGPGVLGTLTFAPLVIKLFYASSFSAAAGNLQWISLGTAMQVITWPVGYIIVAKGSRSLFILVEVLWTAIHLGLAWLMVQAFGLDGAGIAFFGAYVAHLLIVYPIARRLTGFEWSGQNVRHLSLYAGSIATVLIASRALPENWAMLCGGVAVTLSAYHSLRTLASFVAWTRIPKPLRSLMTMLHFAPESTS